MDILKQIFGIIADQFKSIHIIVDIIDIAIVSVIIFAVIKFIRDRRASRLALGVLFIVLMMAISELLNMHALKFLISNIIQIGLIALVIIFQPELRSALEKFGAVSFIKNISESKSSASKHRVITEICETASELSREYTGALIVIERSTPLGDIIKTGTLVNADVNVSLLKNIFFNKAPLHDGAVVIRGGRIYAAGCFLPLSTNEDIIKDLGTRHRSAIGMSENSDALVIVVSEETGTISLAIDGQLRRNYDYNTLKNELSNLLKDDEGTKKRKNESK
ncbi:MAG: diadenylate cyclase CdaA [Clostridia bacterium]|nr:diadenylate cyclase CdaA [Clostridia bacterium]